MLRFFVFGLLLIFLWSSGTPCAVFGQARVFKSPASYGTSRINRVPYTQHNPSKIHAAKSYGIQGTHSHRAHHSHGNHGFHRDRGLTYRGGHLYGTVNSYRPNPYRYPYFGAPGAFQSYYRPSYYYGSYSSAYYGSTNTSSPYGYYQSPYLSSGTRNVSTKRTHSAIDSMIALDAELAKANRVSNRYPNRATLISTQFDAARYSQAAEIAFAGGQMETARKQLSHALVEDPENGYLHLLGAHISLAQQKYGAAQEQLGKATQLLHQNEWDYLIRNRSQLYSTTRFEDDVARLDQYISRNPNSTNALVVRGFVRGCLGENGLAMADLTHVVNADRNHQLAIQLVATLRPNLDQGQQTLILNNQAQREEIEGELPKPQLNPPNDR